MYAAVAVEPVGSGGATVGIAWHDQATGESSGLQRFERAVRIHVEPGTRILGDALARARERVASEVPRSHAQVSATALAELTQGEGLYRDGLLVEATEAIDGAIARLRAEPTAPLASSLLFRAYLLVAQIQRTRGDQAGVEQALGHAIVLDPLATTSTRRLPPELVTLHEQLRIQLANQPDRWRDLGIGVDGAATVEIDGVPMDGPVAVGEHVVVVQRPAMVPEGALVEERWQVPPGQALFAEDLPRDQAEAEQLCDVLELDLLVTGEQRADRLGIQSYRCGQGFGQPWYGPVRDVAAGVEQVLAKGENAAWTAGFRLRAAQWPQPMATTAPSTADRGPEVATRKPWYKRAWVWALVGTVVAGAVVTGAVVGTRQRPSEYRVDADSFLRP